MHMIQLTTNLLKNKQFKGVKWKKSIIDVVKHTDMIIIHTEWNEYRGIDFKKIKKLVKNKLFWI